jgi:hypothetical protein
MADTAVAITPGTGASIDAQSVAGGDLQQTITIGDGANAGRVAGVEALGNKNALDINLAGSSGGVAQVSGTLSSGTANVAATVSNSGNGTIVMFGGTYTALAVVFEATVDGTNWFPIDAVRSDGSAIVLSEQFAAAGIRAWNFMATGYSQVRIRATSGTLTTGPSIIIVQGPMVLDPSPTIAPIDGTRPTFSSALNETNVANAVTASVPMWELVNPTASGKLVRITEIMFSVSGLTAAAMAAVNLQVRSAASTGGTAVTETIRRHDTLNPAPSATSKLYTAIPTVAGSVLGYPRSARIFASTATTQPETKQWQFGSRPGQAGVLRPGESINLQNPAAWATAPILGGHIEWTEESYQ